MKSDELRRRVSNYRLEIRRNEIESFFATKRQLLLEREENPFEDRLTLVEIYDALERGERPYDHLKALSDIMFEQQPFQWFSPDGQMVDDSIIQNYLTRTIELVISTVEQNFQVGMKGDVHGRLICLNVFINVLACNFFTNGRLTAMMLDYVREMYGGVEVWGKDKEVFDVGWVIGNMLGRYEAIRGEEGLVAELLEWAEQLLNVSDQPMLSVVFRGLTIFTTKSQQYHNTPLWTLPQRYHSTMLNIISKVVQETFSSGLVASTIKSALNFLKSVLPIVIVSCHDLAQTLLQKLIPILGSSYTQQFNITMQMLKMIVTGSLREDMPEKEEKISEVTTRCRVYILQNEVNRLFRYMFFMHPDKKVHLIQLFTCLCYKKDAHLKRFIDYCIEESIEDLLLTYLRANNAELTVAMFQFVNQVFSQNNREFGQRFFELSEQISNNDYVGGMVQSRNQPIL